MNEAQHKAVQLLTLSDEEYFAFDRQRLLAVQMQLSNLLRDGARQPPTATPSATPMFVALGAPRQLDFAHHTELPVLLALRYTGQREWEVHHKQNIWLLATELNSGDTHIGHLFHSDKRERTPQPSMSGTPPDSINAKGVRTSVQRIDLRQAVVHEWRPGRLALTAIYYDWKSNTAIMDLRGEDETRQLQLGRASPFLAIIDPPPARTDGIALTLPSAAGQPTTLAFDLPRGNQSIIMDREKQAPLLKATLLLLQLDDKQPVQIDMQVPVKILKPMFGESRLQGAVRFDLRAATERVLAGPYQVYLLAGDRVIGPQAISLE